MSEVQFPGSLTLKERSNIEDSRVSSPIQKYFFEFDVRNVGESKLLITVPVNHIISNRIPIRVIEGFDGNQPLLLLNEGEIARHVVSIPGYSDMFTDPTGEVMRILRVPLQIRLSILDDSSTPPTVGNGWGLLEIINLGEAVRIT